MVATSTGVVSVDLDNGVVEPVVSDIPATAIAADPAAGYAFFTDIDRQVLWRKDFGAGSEVIYRFPPGDHGIRSVVSSYSSFTEASVTANHSRSNRKP